MPHHGAAVVPRAAGLGPPAGRSSRRAAIAHGTAPEDDGAADKFDPDEADWLTRRAGFRTKALGTVDDAAGGVVRAAADARRTDRPATQPRSVRRGRGRGRSPCRRTAGFSSRSSRAARTAYWVGEATAITESTPTTGNLDLQAKKLGVLVKLNNELLRFASPSAEGLVRYDMARAAALKADLAMLEGTGGTQIKGLTTYSGIGSHTASTTGANGDTFQPADVAAMEAKLPDAVDAPTAWVMRKVMFAALMNRRADAVSANDAKGGFLFRNAADDGDEPARGTVRHAASCARRRSRRTA